MSTPRGWLGGAAPSRPTKNSDRAEALTQKEAAERLGISPSTLRKHTKDGRVPRNEDDSYPWPEVRDAYLDLKVKAKRKRQSGFGRESYEDARARKFAAQARLAELDVLEREGELVAADDVVALCMQAVDLCDLGLRRGKAPAAKVLAHEAGISEGAALEIVDRVVERVRAELHQLFSEAADATAA